MQQRDRHRKSNCKPRLFKRIPPPDDLILAPDDSCYLEYFYHLSQTLDLITLPRFVTSFLPQLFNLSLNHYTLRQSLMGEAAGYQSLLIPKTSRHPLHRFMAQVYPSVQQAISQCAFDEGHICAVFQLVKIYLVFGETKGAHRHLQGIRHMIDYLSTKSKELDPLVMSVWRAAFFLDTHLASEGFDYAFPSPEQTDEFHHRWLAKCTQSTEEADLAVAQFALDDIERRAMTAWRKRQLPEMDAIWDRHELELEEASFQRELREWRKRPAISGCMLREASAEDDNEATDVSFLHYPPLISQDQRVGLLLMSYHSVFILTTMLVNPAMGPFARGRFAAAITICRLAANITAETCSLTRPGSIHWHVQDLYRVGLVLGEPFYPLGISTKLNY